MNQRGKFQGGGILIRVGALVPMTSPGWVEAGEHLLAGLELGVRWINDRRGPHDAPVELLVRDTAGDPVRAVAIVNELAAEGVTALAGEYHSVVASVVAERAVELTLPFLCSSAVLDNLTKMPTNAVARIAPAQSQSWRVYADYLLQTGHRRIAVARQSSIYWEAGTEILTTHLASHGAELVLFDLSSLSPDGLCKSLIADGATALLILAGYPEPAVSIVKAVRHCSELKDVRIGAPAGQSEFADWKALLGQDGMEIPFLSYVPSRLPPLGQEVGDALRAQLGCPPSFVAYEGFDTMLALIDALQRREAHDPEFWAGVDIHGTRGKITFSKIPGIPVWQWAWPPIAVAERTRIEGGQLQVLFDI